MSKYIGARLAVIALASSVLGLSGCATSSSVKYVQGAPITYKAGQGGVQYAATTTVLPRSSNLPSGQPSVAIPSPYSSPQASSPQPQPVTPPVKPKADKFDPKKVDRDLYKHQKVGNKYKVMGESYKPKHEPGYDKKGLASWYGDKYHGKPTATGEIFNKNAMTAAHKTLPLNSMLHVTNLETGETLVVRLNDRGPFVKGRIIDLSEAAARQLGIINEGTARVRVRYAGPADPMAPNRMVAAPQPRSAPIPYTPPAAVPAPRRSAGAPPAGPQGPSEYQPLRDYTPKEYAPAVPAQPAPRSVQQPLTPEYRSPEFQAPRPQAPQYQPPQDSYPAAPMTPQAPTPLPVDPQMGGEDDVITLTIKGPIHMAKSSPSDEAKWIQAVNKASYPK